ncbi:TIGR02679 family protein [Vulgatibacter incomptus]|uniref:TIGR02679 family protein n=1 Tax=Vulgatibacter incomptus TaxID=1391653 RepID=A0A0K1PGT2_9BACT|nr:TIGR02679 family protein [Vulgatibacter incomptus]AKU92738.1 Hypothetical protein AKJ08_3125 [Vulgatibacter incomptus]
MSADREKIRTLLGGPRYETLFREARKRREEDGREARAFTLRRANVDERRAAADLFGWPLVPNGTIRISLDELDRQLRASAVEAGLDEVLEALGGPLVNRRALRAATAIERELLWEGAARAVGERPELRAWLDDLRRHGLVSRAAHALSVGEEVVLERAIAAASRLPASGLALAVLAAETTGDAHALDAGSPLGGLVLRAAARIAGWHEPPSTAAPRRALWGEVGIVCDPLSAQVLVLGLCLQGEGRLSRRLRDAALDGEPQRLTLREIGGRDLRPDPAGEIFVCENPSVVAAAADRLGARSGPLVCTEGVPSTAALGLLRELARGGARLRVRGDFDWAGLRIGGQVLREAGGQPWRFCADDYLASLGTGAGRELEGAAGASPWDPALASAMARHGTAVYEEQLLDLLLRDLEVGSS